MTKMKVVKQMGNTVLERLKELAENPVRIREITHSRCFGVARVSQKGSEREVQQVCQG